MREGVLKITMLSDIRGPAHGLTVYQNPQFPSQNLSKLVCISHDMKDPQEQLSRERKFLARLPPDSKLTHPSAPKCDEAKPLGSTVSHVEK